MTPVQDGKPLASGVITAADQEAALTGGRPDDKPLPLSPSQARQRAADEWPDSVGAPGYERKRAVVRSDAEVAKAERVEIAEPSTRERGARAAEGLHTALAKVKDDMSALLAKEDAVENVRGAHEVQVDVQTLKREVVAARSRLEDIRCRTGV